MKVEDIDISAYDISSFESVVDRFRKKERINVKLRKPRAKPSEELETEVGNNWAIREGDISIAMVFRSKGIVDNGNTDIKNFDIIEKVTAAFQKP